MKINATFNNISVISWPSVLLVEDPHTSKEIHLSLKEMLKYCLIVSLVLIQGKFFYIFVYWNWESVDCLQGFHVKDVFY
jgi:hypothetical protein